MIIKINSIFLKKINDVIEIKNQKTKQSKK